MKLPLHFTTFRITVSILVLAIGICGQSVSWVRAVSAYLFSIFALVVAWGIFGIATIGRLPDRTNYGALIGAIVGFVVGVGTGFLMGRKAVHTDWVYWLAVTLVILIFITVPFW